MKGKMRKTAAVIVSLVVSAGLLGGCASNDGKSQNTETSGTAAASETAEVQTEKTSMEADTEKTVTAAADSSEAESSTATESIQTSTEVSAGTSATEAVADVTEETEDTTGTAAGNSNNVLVVYYSATGNTRAVAETIADTADADLFEITPVDPYTDDDLNWNNDDSRVVREHEDEELQDQVELTTTEVENWDSYDTVFIGYPIWWGNAAWPVNQFVQNNDFTGKTVIPFCTSASSGLGESGENLEEMAGTGDWQEGRRFSSNPDEADVTAWVEDVIEG